ncbi:MAG: hypothetical protein KME42_24255 [Tildeniella nuda ZEHNDER 1965/U140]|nr:hypothetical protein [Tildeniella nuda ZEHNDER 1965/U140]
MLLPSLAENYHLARVTIAPSPIFQGQLLENGYHNSRSGQTLRMSTQLNAGF